MLGQTAPSIDTGGLGALLLVLLLVGLSFGVLNIVAWVKIISKAGYSGWWVLAGFVPLLGFIMFLVFAFSDWPILRGYSSVPSETNFGSPGGYPSVVEGPLARHAPAGSSLPPAPPDPSSPWQT